jgi:hypothetical protein
VGELAVVRTGADAPRAPIGNGDLLALESSPDRAERPTTVTVRWSADRWAAHQTFLILGPHTADARSEDTLQSLLDQAHVLFAHFSGAAPATREERPSSPPALATTP